MKLLITLLPISTLILSSVAVPLTVHELVQAPTTAQAQQIIKNQGGVYHADLEESTLKRRGEILQGKLHVPYDASLTTAPNKKAMQALGALLSHTNLGTISTKALGRIQNYIPSLTYAALAQGIFNAWHDVHHSITDTKHRVKAEDAALKADHELATAQYLAVNLVINLVFLLHCPKAHPCERMYALFLLNTLSILGSQGLALQRYLERSNRFYFDSKGLLKSFDPSKGNHTRPKRIKALKKLLQTSLNERQFRYYTNRATTYGINSLRNIPYKGRKSTFGWHYLAGLFKAASTIDVISIRTVPPARVLSNKSNSDFLRLMILCSLNGYPKDSWPQRLTEAQDLIGEYVTTPGTVLHCMKRYYHESVKRYLN